MKKHLTLAIILGAIGFIGVSYLAQAEEKRLSGVSGKPTLAMNETVADFEPLSGPVLWPRY